MISFLGSHGWFWIIKSFQISLMVAFLFILLEYFTFSSFSSFYPLLRHTVSPTDISLNYLDFKWRCYINPRVTRSMQTCLLINFLYKCFIYFLHKPFSKQRYSLFRPIPSVHRSWRNKHSLQSFLPQAVLHFVSYQFFCLLCYCCLQYFNPLVCILSIYFRLPSLASIITQFFLDS